MKFIFINSKSQLVIKLEEDILNFCLKNPFRFSHGLRFLFSRETKINLLQIQRNVGYNYVLNKIDFKLRKILRRKTTYFLNLIKFKKKIKFYFNLFTERQIITLFNSVFKKKTNNALVLKNLLIGLEFRFDIFLYRLNFVNNFILVRSFIKKSFFYINSVSVSNFFTAVQVGDFISSIPQFKKSIYLKYYFFWFNEFMLANSLLKTTFFYNFFKLINLKIYKKKLKSFLLFKFNSFFIKKKAFFRDYFQNMVATPIYPIRQFSTEKFFQVKSYKKTLLFFFNLFLFKDAHEFNFKFQLEKITNLIFKFKILYTHIKFYFYLLFCGSIYSLKFFQNLNISVFDLSKQQASSNFFFYNFTLLKALLQSSRFKTLNLMVINSFFTYYFFNSLEYFKSKLFFYYFNKSFLNFSKTLNKKPSNILCKLRLKFFNFFNITSILTDKTYVSFNLSLLTSAIKKKFYYLLTYLMSNFLHFYQLKGLKNINKIFTNKSYFNLSLFSKFNYLYSFKKLYRLKLKRLAFRKRLKFILEYKRIFSNKKRIFKKNFKFRKLPYHMTQARKNGFNWFSLIYNKFFLRHKLLDPLKINLRNNLNFKFLSKSITFNKDLQFQINSKPLRNNSGVSKINRFLDLNFSKNLFNLDKSQLRLFFTTNFLHLPFLYNVPNYFSNIFSKNVVFYSMNDYISFIKSKFSRLKAVTARNALNPYLRIFKNSKVYVILQNFYKNNFLEVDVKVKKQKLKYIFKTYLLYLFQQRFLSFKIFKNLINMLVSLLIDYCNINSLRKQLLIFLDFLINSISRYKKQKSKLFFLKRKLFLKKTNFKNKLRKNKLRKNKLRKKKFFFMKNVKSITFKIRKKIKKFLSFSVRKKKVLNSFKHFFFKHKNFFFKKKNLLNIKMYLASLKIKTKFLFLKKLNTFLYLKLRFKSLILFLYKYQCSLKKKKNLLFFIL